LSLLLCFYSVLLLASPALSLMLPAEKETIISILAEKGPFESEEDETACRELIEELTPEQLETAAKSSHAYWLTTVHNDILIDNGESESDDPPSSLNGTKIKDQFAMREARRHYIGENRNFDNALKSLQEAISYRDEYKIDLIRYIQKANNLDNTALSSDEKEIVRRYRSYVEDEFGKQVTVSGGLDKENAAVTIRFSRTNAETDPDAFMVTQLYIADRACAATEFFSRGKSEKVVAITEYGDYVSSNAPPIFTLKQSITKLQRMFPERLKKMVLTDPPFWMRALYSMLYPLLAQTTKDKISMTLGPQEKEQTLTELIDVESSLPLIQVDENWSISSDDIDIEQYLNQSMHHTHMPIIPCTP